MQPIPNNFELEESLQKLNTTACKIGKTLKGFVRFLLALLVYVVLNVCVMLLFDYVKPASMEFVHLLDSGLRVFMSQNLTILFSIFAHYKVFTVSIAAVATALSWIVTFSDTDEVAHVIITERKKRKTFSQKAVSRVSVFSYKQHVAFLA